MNTPLELHQLKIEYNSFQSEAIRLHNQFKRLQTEASQVAFNPTSEKVTQVTQLRDLLLQLMNEPPIYMEP